MESNIGKHLVEITDYGTAYHRGTVQSETTNTYVVMRAGTTVGRRLFKPDRAALLPADADVDKVIRSVKEAWKSFDAEIIRAESVLAEVKLRRADAALEAAKAGA